MIFKKIIKTFFLPVALLLSQVAISQNKTVAGKVTDIKDGSGIGGASVLIKGSTGGTNTNSDGSFSLTVPAATKALIISAVGYTEQEVPITDGPINIALISGGTGSNLNEVVVVGYGTARRKDVTGAIATVQAKDFNKGTYTSPDQLIQGKAAGVLVINNTGQPGGSTTIRIRGTSSIRSGNQPLFVIDGVQLPGGSARPGGQRGTFGNDGGNPLNYINPNDIANMEILKDASATAIYGSRGANGVVL
ncbi:MAG: TonB-dependent receptor plug domain-containing protein, partial [Flavitalea sp.]